jgi:hypothetical protein
MVKFSRFSLEKHFRRVSVIFTFDQTQRKKLQKQKVRDFVLVRAQDRLLGTQASTDCPKKMLKICWES